MPYTLSDYGAGFVLGVAGLVVFFYVVCHWRAVCRRIDRWETQKNRALRRSDNFIAFSNLFTPVYLLFTMGIVFAGSIILLVGCGVPIFAPPTVHHIVKTPVQSQ